MDNFSKVCAAILLLLCLAAGALALDAKAEDYSEEPAQQEEQQDSAPSIDTSSYVQVADPALYAKLDTLQDTLDKLVDALAPADADADADTEDSAVDPAPDYTAQLSTISAQLGDLQAAAEMETAETAQPAAFEKPFSEYSVEEVLLLVLAAVVVGAIVLGLVRGF